MPTVGRPEAGEYAPYFERYVALVPGEDPVAALEEQATTAGRMLRGLSEAGAGFRYAAGKWSVREVVGHCADAERVFGYRALSFARGEKAALPPFDENEFARLAGHDGVALAELLDEFAAVRAATLHLLRHLPAAAWQRRGVASGKEISVRAIAFVMAGHVAHHVAILSEKYGVPPRG
ncbi:MAG: DinB family protein [Thermoanaerobaculaceae bacterium]|nr:DinB family protein [Thermoanaerobaculaceae bacterium]